MTFPPGVADRALVACGRHCCICHKFCGTKMELHHIMQKADGGEDSFENCIPLCFDCHAEVNTYNDRHPKGHKFGAKELKLHRDAWYEKVSRNIGITESPDHLKLDRELFLKIREEILPSTGSISYIRGRDYGGAFRPSWHNDFFKFIDYCERPEFEFLDADLEGMRARLVSDINNFVQATGLETFPILGKDDLNRIPRDPEDTSEQLEFPPYVAQMGDKEYQEWLQKRRDHLREVRDELNRLARQVEQTYDEFIRYCRRKLTV